MGARAGLKRCQRLSSAAVTGALTRGRVTRSGIFKLHTADSQSPFAALGLIVPKRLAKRAVDRSRLKRLIRESFRHHQGSLTGLNCVVRLTAPFALNVDYAGQLRNLWITAKRRGEGQKQ